MKKLSPAAPESPDLSPNEISKLRQPTKAIDPRSDETSHNLNRTDSLSQIFTIVPNVDLESLLCHACETLASLNTMSANLASDLEGPRRNAALAIQQFAVLGELLVNRALDIQSPLQGLSETSSTRHA